MPLSTGVGGVSSVGGALHAPHLVHFLPEVDLAGHKLLCEALILVLQPFHCLSQVAVLLPQALLGVLRQGLGLQQQLILLFKLLHSTLVNLHRDGKGRGGGGVEVRAGWGKGGAGWGNNRSHTM